MAVRKYRMTPDFERYDLIGEKKKKIKHLILHIGYI